MTIPSYLSSALADLPTDPRFGLISNWVERPNGIWSFQFRVRLSVPSSEEIEEWTDWHLTVSGASEDRDIRIFPDAKQGIVATFQHQDYNGNPIEGLPWRTGKPCLERPASVFQRSSWAGEPQDFVERLIWNVGRLLSWIDAAAQNELIGSGEPLELPTYPTCGNSSVLGFRETPADFDQWLGFEQTWGFAKISVIPGASETFVVSEFLDPHLRNVRSIPWSPAIPVKSSRVDAVWVKLPKLVVISPWRFAATWAELTSLCKAASVDLPPIIADAGGRIRRIQRPKDASPVHLLLGFPLAEALDGPAQRLHWIAVSNMQLCTRDDVRRGFPSTAGARRARDLSLATSDKPLSWQRTANWAPDQLRKRGEAEEAVRRKSVLILGCGTLGSAVADNLLRMGVTQMGVLDCDTVQVGNLCRHVLTMADAGHGKAVQLSRLLNMAAPDANVLPLSFCFPPNNAADAERLQQWDVIVDCTASDTVLRAMASYPWKTERIFVSLAMTWRAQGLFAFSASETGFPAVDAGERFAAVAPKPGTDVLGEMEGIGCWHPVFPATADDVNLWAAIGSKFVRRAISEKKKMASLYLQKEDGSIERRDA